MRGQLYPQVHLSCTQETDRLQAATTVDLRHLDCGTMLHCKQVQHGRQCVQPLTVANISVSFAISLNRNNVNNRFLTADIETHTADIEHMGGPPLRPLLGKVVTPVQYEQQSVKAMIQCKCCHV